MAELIDGKGIAQGLNLKIQKEIAEIKAKTGFSPKLVSFLIGKSEPAEFYVNMQKKVSEFIGIEFENHKLTGDESQDLVIENVRRFNSDKSVTAIIVQKPLPTGMDHGMIVSAIDPAKDAEGVHPYNLGQIFRRRAEIIPSTPGAVMAILKAEGVDLYGKEVVIIGHSSIVGKPLSLLLLNEMATTTVCHIATHEKGTLKSHAEKADVLIVAVGKAEMVKGDWIKPGAVVIDVGINEVGGKIVGDVKFSEASKKASLITPVPGGVGPVTVSVLMKNVLKIYRKQNGNI
ncbi:MAG: bifunctional 5,10-methylenetetrahydrofolate dehydrogenase/5,10-methenyltetrahydrofolate cyclohydrolase [Candidatus Omnitrophica bacterium]|nr:bifunctional 5,10-methylenetetrahydrofolate dehydrogenase/5,10-methenyltetrahydrofolate cyclohydrolase [Candidatus Omnitrophota bacterium]